MAHRRRRNLPKQTPKRCRCDSCLERHANGVEIDLPTYNNHQRRQNLRDSLGRPVTSSSGSPLVPPAAGSSSNTAETEQPSLRASAHPSDPFAMAIDVDTDNESSAAKEGDRFEALQTEIDSRLSTLNDAQIRLSFINKPSENTPFVFPDPETILWGNSDHFALRTDEACNRHFLESEGRFCLLLKEMQTLSAEDADCEKCQDIVYNALEKLHEIKSKYWKKLAYSAKESQGIMDNGMHILFYPSCLANVDHRALLQYLGSSCSFCE